MIWVLFLKFWNKKKTVNWIISKIIRYKKCIEKLSVHKACSFCCTMYRRIFWWYWSQCKVNIYHTIKIFWNFTNLLIEALRKKLRSLRLLLYIKYVLIVGMLWGVHKVYYILSTLYLVIYRHWFLCSRNRKITHLLTLIHACLTKWR